MPKRASSQKEQLPVQPVEKPIICSPYEEPKEHWVYNTETGAAQRMQGRRPASYWFKEQRTAAQAQQISMFAEEVREDLPLVNYLRQDVKRWRESGYENATQVTKQLLRHWSREDRPRRLFFCQLEAVETVIYLNEILLSNRRPRFRPAFGEEHLEQLLDASPDPSVPALRRLGIKMATGSGKTVVMAMLIAWAFCNRGRVPADVRFPAGVLVVCPNLTIKERLQVLKPDHPSNYYDAFDLVPSTLRPELAKGSVLITNWHVFAPESEHAEGGRSYAVVDKGAESPEALARRVLAELADRGPLMVLNDEGHHSWRPKQDEQGISGDRDLREEYEEATVWVNGLDSINQAAGIRFCADLSATPFYIAGSGEVPGKPFPWLVSDFGLVDAIESGIVKIPRLPVSDTTGRPEPRYFNLWRHITENLQPGERLPGRARKPKPEVVYREAEPALKTLASQWKQRFDMIQEAGSTQDKTPPVLIIVCDNTDIAEFFFRRISGEETVEVVEPELLDDGDNEEESEEEGETPRRRRTRKSRTKTVYGEGAVFPEYLANTEDFSATIRIDSRLLAQAESGDPNVSKEEAADQLRRVLATVGQLGEPGEQVRCVVSVQMLNEGWDAHNVTHILGLRAFESQLLCEQVVGRGLRRMDYTVDPDTGLLTEEYVDIYGVPFSLIPFKGRVTSKPMEEERPKNHVRALAERAKDFEIWFPIVEGYAFALKRNVITADIASVEPLSIEPQNEPTAVYVQPRVGFASGEPSAWQGPGEVQLQDRREYYESTHLQTIEFEIARQIVGALMLGQSPDGKSTMRLQLESRHRLFPQVYRLVDRYVQTRIDFRGEDKRELGNERYVQRVVGRLLDAIRPDVAEGEPPLLPILNRYKPKSSTSTVDFKTTRPCYETSKSHVNLVATDSSWEGSAAFRMEQSPDVVSYVRNDGLEFTIPYEYMEISHAYEPDFLVRLADGRTMVLEIKGVETDQDLQKYEAAKRWVAAVNHWGEMGQWLFHVNREPQSLGAEIGYLVQATVQQ